MRLLFVVLCGLACSLCSGQIPVPGDNLTSRLYDTVSMEIGSKTHFLFCSKSYELPRDCNDSYPANCCSYSAFLLKNRKVADLAYVSCGNGSSFVWHYGNSLENARSNFESIPTQTLHSKVVSKTLIKCIVYDKEMPGYMIQLRNSQGGVSYLLTTYGTYNGYFFWLEYTTAKEIKSNEDIQPAFRHIFRIQSV